MPIPVMNEEESSARRSGLRLVPEGAGGPALFVPRALAHFVDFCVVAGFSVYASKLWSVVLVGLHARAINGSGKLAVSALHDAFDYSSAQLLAASFASLAVAYFVAVPLVLGRTPGMGLFGLRLHNDRGGSPTVRQLAYRMLGCCLGYASGGALCVLGLRKRDGRFFQDVISETRITRE